MKTPSNNNYNQTHNCIIAQTLKWNWLLSSNPTKQPTSRPHKPSHVRFHERMKTNNGSEKECPSTFKHHQPSTINYLTIHI
jgi:hypothetical protein